MHLRGVVSVLAAGTTLLLAGVPRAQPADPPVEPPPAAADTDTASPPTTPAPPDAPPESARPTPKSKPAHKSKPDTRSDAMKAYDEALKARRLAATAPLSRPRLRAELEKAEQKLSTGRRDEAIGDLVTLVESPRFQAFRRSDEGRAMLFLLGDALGRAGAYEPARGYLTELLTGDPKDVWYRRAVRTLVDLGLESGRPQMFLADLAKVPANAPEEARGDIAYLSGRSLEKRRRSRSALAEYAKVTPRSRFWAQATYLSGLIEVERRRFKAGENLFCKVANPKLTPRMAPLFGGSDFFKIRDLARLALGRVAHEEFRFDDARYYYYLVPSDSERLPEALYESATSRYEKKDYGSARDLMNELKALDRNHAYEDEAWLLDAFIDLATCEFPAADVKLEQFLSRYEPVRDAARRLSKGNRAMQQLVEAVRVGADPAAAGTGVNAPVARALGALLRLDAEYATASRQVAQVEHQISGLRRTMEELDDTGRRLTNPKEIRAQHEGPLGASPTEKAERIEAQLAELRRLIRAAERASAGGKKGGGQVGDLRKQLEALEIRARAARAAIAPNARGAPSNEGKDLASVISADRARATELYAEAEKLRRRLVAEQLDLAKDALVRLDRRLSRLLSRARLGKIETVLGKKRALEVEVEALSQGYLPQAAIDSLDAARYLKDDEEYWPFDGEDWADEYVGGEGLR